MSFDPAAFSLLSRLAVALGIGLLIGIERGWQGREARAGGRAAGIRTFALIGLLGGVSGALVEPLGAWPLTAAAIALTGAIAWFKYREGEAQQDLSVTSVVAALLVFFLGALAVVGSVQVATSAGIATVILLAARETLHEWVRRLTWQELRSGLLLAAMTFLALPLLPDRTIDPLSVINPHELWLLTILIAAISAVGYVAVKAGGPARGLVYASLAGGLVSSTATTLSVARLARESPTPGLLAACASLSSAVSIARVYVLAVALSPVLWALLLIGFLPAVLVLVGGAVLAWRKADIQKSALAAIAGRYENPVELKFVLRFGALLACVLIGAELAARFFGEESFLVIAGVMGLADVDPVTLTAVKLSRLGNVDLALAGILIAVAMNVAVKAMIGFVAGGTAFGARLCLSLGGAIVAAALALSVARLLRWA